MVNASIPHRRGLLVALLLLIASSLVACQGPESRPYRVRRTPTGEDDYQVMGGPPPVIPKVSGRARFNSPASGTIGNVWIDITVLEDSAPASTTKVEVYGHSSSNPNLPSAPYGYHFETVNSPMSGDPPKWMLVNDLGEWDSTKIFYFVIVIVHEGMYQKRWWQKWTMPSTRMDEFNEE